MTLADRIVDAVMDGLPDNIDSGIVTKAEAATLRAAVEKAVTSVLADAKEEFHYADHGVAGGWPHAASACSGHRAALPLLRKWTFDGECEHQSATIGSTTDGLWSRCDDCGAANVRPEDHPFEPDPGYPERCLHCHCSEPPHRLRGGLVDE